MPCTPARGDYLFAEQALASAAALPSPDGAASGAVPAAQSLLQPAPAAAQARRGDGKSQLQESPTQQLEPHDLIALQLLQEEAEEQAAAARKAEKKQRQREQQRQRREDQQQREQEERLLQEQAATAVAADAAARAKAAQRLAAQQAAAEAKAAEAQAAAAAAAEQEAQQRRQRQQPPKLQPAPAWQPEAGSSANQDPEPASDDPGWGWEAMLVGAAANDSQPSSAAAEEHEELLRMLLHPTQQQPLVEQQGAEQAAAAPLVSGGKQHSRQQQPQQQLPLPLPLPVAVALRPQQPRLASAAPSLPGPHPGGGPWKQPSASATTQPPRAAPAAQAAPAGGMGRDDECVICMDAPRQALLAPCGHRTACLACTDRLMEGRHPGGQVYCPLCGEPVESIIRRVWS